MAVSQPEPWRRLARLEGEFTNCQLARDFPISYGFITADQSIAVTRKDLILVLQDFNRLQTLIVSLLY